MCIFHIYDLSQHTMGYFNMDNSHPCINDVHRGAAASEFWNLSRQFILQKLICHMTTSVTSQFSDVTLRVCVTTHPRNVCGVATQLHIRNNSVDLFPLVRCFRGGISAMLETENDTKDDEQNLGELQRLLDICERQRRVERCVVNTGRAKGPVATGASGGRSLVPECPENILLMKRLIQTCTHLDRDRKKALSRLNAEKQHWKIKHSDLLQKSNVSELEETFLHPPGFR